MPISRTTSANKFSLGHYANGGRVLIMTLPWQSIRLTSSLKEPLYRIQAIVSLFFINFFFFVFPIDISFVKMFLCLLFDKCDKVCLEQRVYLFLQILNNYSLFQSSKIIYMCE